MITSITVEDFKCFEALELPCAPLTVLTGYNAAGKSTALQTLLLLAQALRAATGGSARGAAGAARTGMRVCIVRSGPAGRGRLKKRGTAQPARRLRERCSGTPNRSCRHP